MIVSSRLSQRLATGAVALAVVLVLSGCGRRGDPLPPPDPSAPKPAASASSSSTEDVKNVFEPGGGYSSEKAPPLKRPDKPLPIDPLLN